MSWEGIIDQMKDWVISQAYATEAWVLAKVYATEAWVLAKVYATELFVLQQAMNVTNWVIAQNYLQTGFVDRGDPAAADWREGAFIADSTWRDLDLSAIVPAGAKIVAFTLWHKNTLVNKDLYLRKKGNVNSSNISSIRTQVAAIFIMQDLVCPCDSNRFVQYWLTAGGIKTIYLTVKGWWL